jgi:hypothetical protein
LVGNIQATPMVEAMQDSPSLWKWVRVFAMFSPLSFIWMYVFFHLFFGVPSSHLIFPSLVICSVMVMQAPLMYYARRYSDYHQKDKRIIVLVLAEYFVVLTLLGLHYAVSFRVLDAHAGVVLSWTLTVFNLFIAVLALFRNKPLRGTPEDK